MKLAELNARTMSFDDVRGLFPGATWLWNFDNIEDGTPVHFVEGELAVESFEAGRGPWVLIVHGDLIATGDLDFSTSDYKHSLLVVCGSLRARNFQFTNGAACYVLHDLTVENVVIGRYGDESAMLGVEGTLTAHAVLLDHVTGIGADAIDAVVCCSEGWRLPVDILYEAASHANIFDPEVLGEDQQLELWCAWQRATVGQSVLLPGVRERLRAQRPEPWRHANNVD